MSYGKRKRYTARGRASGTFNSRPKSSLSSALRDGVVVKAEKQGTASDSKCLYIGHNSHPVYDTMRTISYAIVRLVCKLWHRDVTDILMVLDTPLQFEIAYQDVYNGIVNVDSNAVATGSTIKDIGDALMNRLIALITSSVNNFFVREIRFGTLDLDTGALNAYWSLSKIVFFGNDLKITVNGNSTLKLQNITVSSTGDSVANEQADDIASNPLRGKRYFGKGYQHRFRFNQDTTTSSPIMCYNGPNGFLANAYTAFGTGFDADFRRSMQKPPPFRAFTNMKGSAYVGISPGEIKSSVVKDSYTMNINGWIYKLFECFKSFSTIGTPGTDAPIQPRCDLGKNSLIALEHVVDIGSEPDVTVAYELTTTTSAVARHRHQTYCNPYNDSSVPSS